MDSHDLFGSEFGESVIVAHRSDRIVFAVVAPVAPEDVVGGDVHQWEISLLKSSDQIARACHIDLPAVATVAFGARHVGVGRGVDHQLRAVAFQSAVDVLRIGDVQLLSGWGDHARQEVGEFHAQAAAAAREEDARAHASTVSRFGG